MQGTTLETEYQQGLLRYAEPLLRKVASNFLKLRNKPSIEVLREKLLAGYENAALIDRRISEVSPQARTLLGILRLGFKSQWKLATVLEVLSSLAPADAVTPDGIALVFELLEAGLVVPEIKNGNGKFSSFETWLSQAGQGELFLLTIPAVLARSEKAFDALPAITYTETTTSRIQSSDGLGWFLRLGFLWQTARSNGFKLAQSGDFFKKDMERLSEQEPILASLQSEAPVAAKDPGYLLMSIALATGLFQFTEPTQISAARSPHELWNGTFAEQVRALFSSSLELSSWTPADGWKSFTAPSTPQSAAGLLGLASLVRAPTEQWLSLTELADWVARHHPYWKPNETSNLVPWANGWTFGILFPLGLIEAMAGEASDWLIRLSPLGRHLFLGTPLPPTPEFPKTMYVQPNLEIMVYRQGLTHRLIAELSRFANWKLIGPACTLTVESTSIYRGLEAGCTGDSILAVLQSYSVKEPPTNVLDSIRTWSAKRDRLTVYGAACLVEFYRPEDLDAAIARGMAGQRLNDRILLVENEESLDLKQFRMAGTRDYSLPPGNCVETQSDGVTLHVDAMKADLLLETEIRRFAERQELNGQKWVYKVTPASMQQARQLGLSQKYLEEWYQARSGQPSTPAVKMLWKAADWQPSRIYKQVVFSVSDVELADGIWQWPETRGLIEQRLGPLHFHIEEALLPKLEEKLREIQVGATVEGNGQLPKSTEPTAP